MELIIVIFSIILHVLGFMVTYLGVSLCTDIDAEEFYKFIGIMLILIGIVAVAAGIVILISIGG